MTQRQRQHQGIARRHIGHRNPLTLLGRYGNIVGQRRPADRAQIDLDHPMRIPPRTQY